MEYNIKSDNKYYFTHLTKTIVLQGIFTPSFMAGINS